MSRALVTGGSGFLGRHLADALADAGYDVAILDVEGPPPGARHRFVRADVRDAAAVASAAQGCDVVVDNAALVPVTDAGRDLYEAVNVTGCRNTLLAAEAEGAYALHISSSAIYGIPRELPVTPTTPVAPFEPYGESKARAEEVVEEVRARGGRVGSLRPRTLLGPGRLGIFDVIFARIAAGKRVPMFSDGSNRVQMCDVGDFCAAALAAIKRRDGGDHNVGSAGFRTVREDLAALIEHAGTAARLQPVPVWAIRAALWPLAVIGRSPINEWHLRSAPASFYFDLDDTQRALGWAPRRTNAEALANAYDHYRIRAGSEGGSVHRRPLEGVVGRLLRGR